MKSEAAPMKRPGPLLAALMELRRTTPESSLARELGVAPKTLKRIFAGTFVEMKGAQEDEDASQRRAWAQTITNLAIKVSERTGSLITPETALREEFGLNTKDKVIETAMSHAIFGLRQVAKQTDPVLNNIEMRGQLVHVGILIWPPISEKDSERSFGPSFCRRLVGALNPRRWDVQYEDRETINDCLDRVLTAPDISPVTPTGVKGDDIAFGVYPTVSRQLRGLDYLPVPGVGIPLHALYFRPPHLKELRVDWATIGQRTASEDLGVQAYVLEEEVGELYLRGPCGYPAEDVVAFTTFNFDAIAEELKNPPSDKLSIFVADRPTCIRVGGAMRKRPEVFKGWSLDDPSFPGTNFNDPGFPVYRLGMAFRADSERWASLLKAAVQEELFFNDRAWTASLYADLFTRHFKELSLVPLEPTLPRSSASMFAKAVHDLLVSSDDRVKRRGFKRRDGSLDPETRDRLHRELREVWGVTAADCNDDCAREEEEVRKTRDSRR